MGAHLNLRQGTKILRFAMIGALGNSTSDVFVRGFVHCFSPRFLLGSLLLFVGAYHLYRVTFSFANL